MIRAKGNGQGNLDGLQGGIMSSTDTTHNPFWLMIDGRVFLDCKGSLVEIYPTATQFTSRIFGLDIRGYRVIPLWRKVVRGLFGI